MQLRQQFWQHGQNVVPLAVDAHAQGQVKPGRLAVVTAHQVVTRAVASCPLACELHLQVVGTGNPVAQAGVYRHLASRAPQRGKVFVGPLQPALLVGGG